MDALILTCGTGGGHNMAALAIKNELLRQGHNAVMMNPYDLYSKKASKRIDYAYISLVRNCPALFGLVYKLGNLYRKLPFRSPVYHINRSMAPVMERFLRQTHFDVIITTHLFPAEIVTQMKMLGMEVPKTIFIATDYTCIPFTEETLCDQYVIPSEKCREDFIKRGIPSEKIQTLGIPVVSGFAQPLSKLEARKKLGLSPKRKYILLCGGSMGAGRFFRLIQQLLKRSGKNVNLIVICGSNEKLYRKMREKFTDRVVLLQSTDKMALYVHACDVYLTKPGGLSTTEAAVAGVPLVHLPPIPGCETVNAKLFESLGMSIRISANRKGADAVLALLEDPAACGKMIQKQREYISCTSARDICNLAGEQEKKKQVEGE